MWGLSSQTNLGSTTSLWASAFQMHQACVQARWPQVKDPGTIPFLVRLQVEPGWLEAMGTILQHHVDLKEPRIAAHPLLAASHSEVSSERVVAGDGRI